MNWVGIGAVLLGVAVFLLVVWLNGHLVSSKWVFLRWCIAVLLALPAFSYAFYYSRDRKSVV